MKIKGREFATFLFCAVFSVLLILLDNNNLLNSFKRPLQDILLPFQKQISSINFNLGSTSQQDLARDERIATLEQENSLLLAQLSQSKNLELENEKIRKLLGADLSPRWRFSPAQVVGAIGDELLLSSNHEAKQDEIVLITSNEGDLWKSGLYVGRVEETEGNIIKVILPTSPRSLLAVTVRTKDSFEKRSSGILEGRGGRVLLDQVIQTEKIEAGDLIFVTPSQTNNLQEELLVGRITQVFSDASSFRKADAEILIDPKKLDLVFLLTKK